MSLSDIKKMKSEKGFTIVELLIVIVVIGILAAIVIVAYNGVTQRANATKASTNAASVQKKAEAYYNDTSGGNGVYPATAAIFAGLPSTALGAVPNGITVGAADPTAANGTTTLRYTACGASTAANNNSATGYYVAWWDFSASALKYYIGGSNVTGTGAANGTYTSVTCAAFASTS